jgi:hypothetical protein
MRRGLTSRKMRSEGWKSIWELKEQNTMDMDKVLGKFLFSTH